MGKIVGSAGFLESGKTCQMWERGFRRCYVIQQAFSLKHNEALTLDNKPSTNQKSVFLYASSVGCFGFTVQNDVSAVCFHIQLLEGRKVSLGSN